MATPRSRAQPAPARAQLAGIRKRLRFERVVGDAELASVLTRLRGTRLQSPPREPPRATPRSHAVARFGSREDALE